MKTDILLWNTPFGIKELQRKSKNDSQLDRHSNEHTLMPDRVGVAAREPKQNVTIKPYKNQGGGKEKTKAGQIKQKNLRNQKRPERRTKFFSHKCFPFSQQDKMCFKHYKNVS